MGENTPGRDHRSGGMGRWKGIRQFIASIPLLLVLFLYWGQTLYLEWEGQFGYGQVGDYGLPEATMEQFRFYDSDASGYIDPYEFVSLLQHLDQEGKFQLDYSNYSVFEFIDEEIGLGKEIVVVEAEMEPLVTETMTKFQKGEGDFIFGSVEKLLPGLLQWKVVHVPSQIYGARNFRYFLPPNDWPIGRPYYIIKDASEFTSMNRYHPPQPSPENALLHSILAQFHPNIFLMTRFGPKGTVGVVRAKNKDMIDVVFRVHVEYQLNEVPDYPFWLTPAQFTGHLVTDLECHHIHYFQLKLPTDNQLNIDMEWITGQGSNEVDIGYIPLMQLSSSSSLPWKPDSSSASHHKEMFNYSSIVWDHEIPMSRARHEIEETMYPFKKVKYFSFLDAISHALTENKLIHLIMLWGALDDQSC